ncbi:iron-containing alcohol dehydrogenase [Synergistes jonesii]|uniref:Uncharacterized protein n=1 Tax=Synergistes jonesii TaxID=2754 RepID=A0A073IPB2_9BACT|nr:iron-containing alcohol dehydrogenase [Synergistes jonesii]KEJ91544.1 hypothetical protein EH55_09050 [Synergistes jonesii]
MFYTFHQPVKVLYGVGAVAKIGEVVKDGNYTKAFVVYDSGVKGAGIVDKVTKGLEASGIGYELYDKVIPDPPSYLVDEGFKVFEKSGCDCVIAVGGGSSIDTAKGINILRFNEGPILRYANPENVIGRSPGLITIPTTAGTGSEVSNGLIISDPETHIKNLLVCYNAMSEFCVIDPELMMGMPKKLTAYTGSDVLAHLVESYTTNVSTKLNELISEKFISVVYEWLPQAVDNGQNIEARENMGIASSMGGWCLSLAFAHAGHSIAHTLGAKYGMVHGAACAYADPEVLRWIAPTCPGKIKKIAEMLGATFKGNETPEQIGEKVCEVYKAFNDRIGIPPIETWNCDLSRLDEVAEAVSVEACGNFSVQPLTFDAAKMLLKKIFGVA